MEIYLFLGFLLFLASVITLIETYHYRYEDEGSVPTVKGGISAGFVFAFIVIWILAGIASNSGESGFGIVMFLPVIFIVSIVGGAIIGVLYKKNGTTIVRSRRNRKHTP